MTCLPPPSRVAPQVSFFGGAGPAEHAGLAARAGIRWWRLDGSSGGPSEADLNALQSNGLAILCSAPASTAAARSLAARSRGRIAAFEVGAGLEAAQALSAAAPRPLLVDGGRLASDARAGLRRAPGVAAVSYDRPSDPESVAPASRGGDPLSRELRDLRVRAGGLPLWNIDGGAPCPSFYSWSGGLERSRASARALARSLILSRASGVERFFVPVWGPSAAARTFDTPSAGDRWLLDFDGGARPTLAALAACAAALDGSQRAGRVEASGFRAYVFQQGADTVVAAWSPAAREAPRDLVVRLDRNRVRATNLMGNPRGVKWGQGGAVAVSLRSEPVYIRVQETGAASVLRILQSAAASPMRLTPVQAPAKARK